MKFEIIDHIHEKRWLVEHEDVAALEGKLRELFPVASSLARNGGLAEVVYRVGCLHGFTVASDDFRFERVSP